MNFTSIEQSNKLLKLGLSPKSADGFYTEFGDIIVSEPCKDGMEPAIPYTPCWSLTTLLELLPKKISEEYSLQIQTFNYNTRGYAIGYMKVGGISYKTGKYYHLAKHVYENKILIDAAFELVVLLLENGYIKTK